MHLKRSFLLYPLNNGVSDSAMARLLMGMRVDLFWWIIARILVAKTRHGDDGGGGAA